MEKPELYFKTDTEWRTWLHDNYDTSKGIYLIFYKVENKEPSMRWEEAVKVALCYGWIDSTVKSLGNGKRRQYFCPRKPKSVWSALNKSYIKELTANNLMHQSGLAIIKSGKKNGSWTALDDVEKGIIPETLQLAFNKNPKAFSNYNNFAPSYRKSYLYWLNQAKREETKEKRIAEIIRLCDANIKDRGNW
ncbi:YdeI/OmpD-associated family protein [Winogradskyella immobilis]|uniref:YdeI/OmpD-associated family protein n=1 Tax=Winogradskyella immobilis TaxID=2816852 RepID=A0ABS8EPF4_9FLAO|nr:YdeI/OmpD-associated family protein [Winogradskyella immobilis]MCC1484995.1 YdeI/OmpD-associated family protein [Winogradskyella immobilis]MCG0017087.1 YdeI/OmpD-associated family protein [Winogradskyella immobilis]